MVVTYGVYFDTRISRVWCNYTIRGLEESINGIFLLHTHPYFYVCHVDSSPMNYRYQSRPKLVLLLIPWPPNLSSAGARERVRREAESGKAYVRIATLKA